MLRRRPLKLLADRVVDGAHQDLEAQLRQVLVLESRLLGEDRHEPLAAAMRDAQRMTRSERHASTAQ